MVRPLAACLLSFLAFVQPGGSDNWPQFRGPRGDGHSPAAQPPLRWSEMQNVRWKTAIHGKGWSSPVIWGSQIWMTSATEDGRQMFGICVDRNSGQVLFDKLLFENPKPEPLGNDVNGYGSPTPVIEDGRVYIHFGSYGTTCIDTNTIKPIWTRKDLPCRHYRGPSSSPIVYENLLILTQDGIDLQYTVALDKRSGETKWKTDRTAEWDDIGQDGKPYMEGDQRKAHSTPIITSVGGRPVMVSAGSHAVYGYDPRNGRELWKVKHKGYSASFRPLIWQSVAFVPISYGRPELWAMRIDGQGDETSNVIWKVTKGVPSKPSPILIDGLIYMVSDGGIMTCLDIQTGAQVWQERISGHYSASPIYANGLIYCCNEEGKTVIVRPGRRLDVVAENQLSDGFMSSPAALGRALYLRTRSALYRIEE